MNYIIIIIGFFIVLASWAVAIFVISSKRSKKKFNEILSSLLDKKIMHIELMQKLQEETGERLTFHELYSRFLKPQITSGEIKYKIVRGRHIRIGRDKRVFYIFER